MSETKSKSTKRVSGPKNKSTPRAATFQKIRIEGRPDALYVYVDDVEVNSAPLAGKYFELIIEPQDVIRRKSEVVEKKQNRLEKKVIAAAKADTVSQGEIE